MGRHTHTQLSRASRVSLMPPIDSRIDENACVVRSYDYISENVEEFIMSMEKLSNNFSLLNILSS